MGGGGADFLLGPRWKCCCFLSVGWWVKSWVFLGFCCLLVGVTGAYFCTLPPLLEQWWLVLFLLLLGVIIDSAFDCLVCIDTLYCLNILTGDDKHSLYCLNTSQQNNYIINFNMYKSCLFFGL